MPQPFNPNTEELYHVAGDMDTGVTTDVSLTKSAFAKPQIRYSGRFGEFVLTCELYKMGNELSLHLICPRCRNALWIKSSKKQMHWDSDKGLSIEPFECTWELEGDSRRMEFGLGLCRWRAAIDKNIAKDA